MMSTAKRLSLFLLTLAGGGLISAGELHLGSSTNEESIPDFESRLLEIDHRLDRLASLSLQTGMGAIGFRSVPSSEATCEHWIQVDLGEEREIDQVVLVPSIWRDTRKGYIADAFPDEFRIKAVTHEEPGGELVASVDKADGLLPRIAPVIFGMPAGTRASKLKIEVLRLSPRIWDRKYVLQLAEILVFSGEENIAMGGEVTTSFAHAPDGGGHSKGALTDGFLPYLMDAATGEQSLAAVGNLEKVDPAVIELDFGEVQRVSWLHLHRIDLNDSVPQAVPADFGIPNRLLIEGARRADFSDAQLLVDFQKYTVFDVGPIIARRFPETGLRYLRLSAVEPYEGNRLGGGAYQIGLAEIEVFSPEGVNVAREQPLNVNFSMVSKERTARALVDGRNFYGDIISIRGWLNQLAERHDLEKERPLLVAELGKRYELQKANLRRLGWIVVFLVVSAVIIILVYRILQMRQIGRIRERLAADLHDELGANLHTIGLLSDMADDERNSRRELSEMHRRIRSETVRSGVAVRHCADMLEAGELYKDLVGDMKRSSKRILAKHAHKFSYEGKVNLLKLTPRQRSDLFLFYKECLVNASRHSGASEFRTQLKATPSEVSLTIADNGQGLPDASKAGIPPSLLRRAKLLGAKVSVKSSSDKGTQVNLKLKNSKWRLPG